MVKENFIALRNLAETLQCKWKVFTEASQIVSIKSESTVSKFDDTAELVYALRTNQNAAFDKEHPMQLSVIDYSHIEMVSLDMTKEMVIQYLTSKGLMNDPDIVKLLNDSKQLQVSAASNYNSKKDEDDRPMGITLGR